MTRKAEIILEWADGEFLFALKSKQIEELQVLCKAGFGELTQRVFLGTWFYRDIYETIRLGLMGGGMGAVEAKRKVDMYVDGQPLADPKAITKGGNPNSPESVAKAILSAVTFGIDDLDLPTGEVEAGMKGDS